MRHETKQDDHLVAAFESEMSDPHRVELVEELRADRNFLVEYARTAFELATNVQASSDDRVIGFTKLRTVAQACGGMATVARRSSMKREQLYRMLSGKGNPTVGTLTPVLHAMGLRLTIAEDTEVNWGEIITHGDDQIGADAHELAPA